jgi:flagellar hook-associated protein 1 FlgK
MLGLFGTLNLAARSLQTQQTGIEVTGQNLANVNNPAYARQRVDIQTSISIPTPIGPEGTGADVVAIQQLRDALVDGQIRNEQSVGGYWTSQQSVLQNAQTNLGEFLNSTDSLSTQLSGLFNAFQDVATSPTATNEQALINQAQSLTGKFNQVSQSLTSLGNSLNASLNNDVQSANGLLSDIASLNNQIAAAENPAGGTANDLRDLREQKLEQLAQLVNIQTSTGPDGSVNIAISGSQLVSGSQVLDTLQTYDPGNGNFLVRTATSATPLTLTGGSLQGTIDARDGTLQNLSDRLNTLASTLITAVNNVHQNGFSASGTTGEDFFTGTDAATIGVNATLVNDPTKFQAAGVAGAPGDNTVALALAQLAQQTNPALGNQTFSDAYGQIVSNFGNALNNVNNQLSDHDAVNTMLLQQRSSVSGVSIDEEMTNLMTYQRAYQASAKIVTTVDQMLDTVINMKQTTS